jgi:hypothetical protein
VPVSLDREDGTPFTEGAVGGKAIAFPVAKRRWDGMGRANWKKGSERKNFLGCPTKQGHFRKACGAVP